MSLGKNIKKLRNVFKVLSSREQGEALRLVTNKSIITGLSKIKDIKDLTGYSLLEHTVTTKSTPSSNKQKLIQKFLDDGRITGFELNQHGYSITAMNVSVDVILVSLRRNQKVVDNFPEFLI